MTSDVSAAPAAPLATLAFEQAFQDGLIARRLPPWIARLDAGQRVGLCDALKTSLECRQRLQTHLASLKRIDVFAETALREAFGRRFGAEHDIAALQFRQGDAVPLRGQLFATRTPVSVIEYVQVPLMEAVLRNFTPEQATARGQLRGNGLLDSHGVRLVTPSAYRFARFCRALDLGAQYQQHLESVFGSGPTVMTQADNVGNWLAQLQRCTLLGDAYKAHADGVLDAGELDLLRRLCDQGQLGTLEGAAVVAKRLRLLGCDLEQVIVFDVIDGGLLRNVSKRVLVYIPGDPHGPWSVHDDLQGFARQRLGQRLRDAGYLRFFARFVRRRDSQRFFSSVVALYRDVATWATRELDEHMSAYPTPLFEHLAAARIRQIKDDAAAIIPPVERLDRDEQLAHEQRLAAEGWTLLGLAGLFVPAIGAALLGTLAWELLAEVFHGVEQWHDGDTKAALDHLGHVAMGVGVAAGTVVGIGAARQAWRRSAFVDSLSPARLENGEEKLWHQELAPFRGAVPPDRVAPDVLGLRRYAGQDWLELDQHYYPVRQRECEAQWQLAPRDAFGPPLCGNGAGAWRLESERPWEWADPQAMFRRLGGRFSELDAPRMQTAMSIHGLEADVLRALHMHNQVPEAGLVDTVQRLLLEQRIQHLIDQLRLAGTVDDTSLLQHARRLPGAQALPAQVLADHVRAGRRALFGEVYASIQDSDTAASARLRRLFPRLPARVAQALLQRADVADLRRLQATGRVPLRLAEAAREGVRHARVARVLEALRHDTPQGSDLARVAIGLLEDRQGAAANIRWHLLEGHAQGPLLAQAGQGIRRVDLVHDHGAFLLLDGQGNAAQTPGELFEVMSRVLDVPADELRRDLARLAFERRAEVERLLGDQQAWFRPPLRTLDGRVGYPLSGRLPRLAGRRGRPRALVDRVHGLFPELDQSRIDALLQGVQASGQPIELVLERIRRQSEQLGDHLRRWTRRAPRGDDRDQRDYFTEALINCWQRSVAEELIDETPITELWWSQMGARPGELPELPEGIRINRVVVLSMRGMELDSIPDGFLRAFPNVRVLELPGNRLTRLPGMLTRLRHLECLDLFNNQITLSAADAANLAGCSAMRYLNLSFNPLGRSFPVSGMGELVELRLGSARLRELPRGVMSCPRLHTLDLRDNMLTALPPGFYRSRPWSEGRVWLQGNPLSAGQQQRLRQALAAPIPMEQPVAQVVVPRLRWLDAIDSRHRNDLGAIWALVEAHDEAGAFFSLLHALTHTADFASPAGARDLARRVLEMLQVMEEQPTLRQELLASASALTCHDSVALRFTDLELRVLVWRAEQGVVDGGREQTLLRLGRQLWRLDAVDRIALEDVRARRSSGERADDIEVLLAYRLALRKQLDLPVQTQEMLFGSLSGVGPHEVEQALARVQEAESSEQLAYSLVERDFWRTYLLHRHAQRFEALNAPFHRQLEALMADHEMAEATRIERIGQIQAQRAQAERDTLLDLTRRALDGRGEEVEVFV